MAKDRKTYQKPTLTAKSLRLGVYGSYNGDDRRRSSDPVDPIIPPIVKPRMEYEEG